MRSIREENTVMLLRNIFFNENISRSELSAQTKLNKASVSEIIKVLLEDEIIIEKGAGDSTDLGGRRPIKLAINKKYGLAIGIDIGVRHIEVRTMTLNKEIVYTNSFLKTDDFVEDIENEIQKMIKMTPKKYNKIMGVTLSIQGMVSDNRIMFTPNYNVVDLEELKDKYSFPVYIENEANLAAFAHGYFDRSEKNITAAITLRTGIGSGLMLEGKIYKGLNGGAGEIGHTIVFPKGRKCPCGNKGCLEQYASEKAVIAAINDNIKSEDLHIHSVEDFELVPIEILHQVLNETIEFLAICTNNLINTYGPSHVYFSGRIFDSYPKILGELNAKLDSVFARTVNISISDYGSSAPVIGSCLYTIDSFINAY